MTVLRGNEKIAVIDGHSFSIGDEIDGAVIINIALDSVTAEDDGELIIFYSDKER